MELKGRHVQTWSRNWAFAVIVVATKFFFRSIPEDFEDVDDETLREVSSERSTWCKTRSTTSFETQTTSKSAPRPTKLLLKEGF